MHAIRDRAVVEQRRKHLVHGLQHRCLAAHVEERFLLAGERRFRQILRRGRGAHRDRDLAAVAHRCAARRAPPFRYAGGKGVARIQLADRAPGGRERGDIVDVECRRAPSRCARPVPLVSGIPGRRARSWRSRRAPARRASPSEPIISPREAFLPPTVSTSCMPSCSKGMTYAFKCFGPYYEL